MCDKAENKKRVSFFEEILLLRSCAAFFVTLADRNAHRIEGLLPRFILAWNNFAFSVGISTIEELVQPLTAQKCSWAFFEGIKREK